MGYRKMAENDNDPEDRNHPIEEGSCSEDKDSFGPFHDTHVAIGNNSLCFSTGVRDHHGSPKGEHRQNDRLHALTPEIKYQNTQEEQEI